MKKVLSLLLVFVFLKAQALALSGGPVFPGSQTTYIGIYSGVLTPKNLGFTSSGTSSGGTSTSVGLFTLDQPQTGLANGSILIFVDGTPFTGVINGSIDPRDGGFDGVIDAASTFVVTLFIPQTTTTATGTVTTFTSQTFPINGNGSMSAEVLIESGVLASTNGTTSVTPSRLVGDASIDIFFFVQNDGTPDITKTAVFDVDGFKQSDVSALGTGGITAGTGTGGTGG